MIFFTPFHSGDTDAVVPVTATRYSIDALKLPTLVNWYPWYDHGKVSILKTICSSKQILGQNESFEYMIYSSCRLEVGVKCIKD